MLTWSRTVKNQGCCEDIVGHFLKRWSVQRYELSGFAINTTFIKIKNGLPDNLTCFLPRILENNAGLCENSMKGGTGILKFRKISFQFHLHRFSKIFYSSKPVEYGLCDIQAISFRVSGYPAAIYGLLTGCNHAQRLSSWGSSQLHHQKHVQFSIVQTHLLRIQTVRSGWDQSDVASARKLLKGSN